MHRISLFGYDDEGREALESIGLSVRPARKGSDGWRFETANKDLGAIMATVRQIQRVLDVSVASIRPHRREPRRGHELAALPAGVVGAARAWSWSTTRASSTS